MAIEKLNPTDFSNQMGLKDKNWTDWHSKNTIIFGSLIDDGWDWGKSDWKAYTLSAKAEPIVRARINKKIEDRYYFRELGVLPIAAFRRNLRSRIEEAVSRYGLIYNRLVDGLDLSTGETESLRRRLVESEYPQAILQPKTKDYASSADEEAWDKKKTIGELEVTKFLFEIEEPDGKVLESLNRCFSQLLSFNY